MERHTLGRKEQHWRHFSYHWPDPVVDREWQNPRDELVLEVGVRSARVFAHRKLASPKDAGFFPAPQTLVDETQVFDLLGRDSGLRSYALGGPGRFTTGIFTSGWATFLRLPK